MNHYMIEVLARDHIAELRREADRPRSEPAADSISRPVRVPTRVLNGLVTRLLVMISSPRDG